MFKNTLFLKIVLVFTLPALGMMFFSTILVYEKIQILDELHKSKLNVKYMNTAENLINTIQKERGYSVIYLSSKKFKNELIAQRKITDKKYKNFVKFISDLNSSNTQFIYGIKKIQNSFYQFEFLRKNIDGLTPPVHNVLLTYSDVNKLLIESIVSINPVQFASEYNTRLETIINLLTAKESAAIERALIGMLISNKDSATEEIYKYLLKLQTVQEINLKEFSLKADILEIDKYNRTISVSSQKKIENIRNNIKQINNKRIINTQDWWQLSTSRIDSMGSIIHFSSIKILELSNRLEADAYMSEILSLSFLMVSFLTLISLFFVLKNIIFNEQKSFNKISKQQIIYDVLNKTNNILLKITDEKKLFDKICSLIIKETHMPFGFICKLNNKTDVEILASEGLLKDYLINKVNKNNKDKTDIGLARQAFLQKSNLIVDNLSEDNISGLLDVADRYNLKSAAAFPIKKFDKVFAVMVIYSDTFDYFDKEIEILFNKMINDISHTLEKIEYEKIRLDQENELRIASYAFESHEPMIITDNSVKIIKVNKAFCDMSGFTKEELIGNNPKILKSEKHNAKFYGKMWNKLADDGTWTGELYNKRKNSEVIPLRVTITAIKNNNGDTMHYIAQYIDITEQKEKQKVLEYQATHDNLTGLPNRLLLLDRIKQSLFKVTRYSVIGGLVFIDLDNFKTINDTLGHEVGDHLLIEVGLKLRQTVREEDTIARIGGDEFIILVDCIGNNNEEAKVNMKMFAQKIKDSLNSITEILGHKNISTPSIGVTLFNGSSKNVNEIIKQADTAMYEAKRAGKNRIEFFKSEE